jgi:Mg-chelatase subunit ChlD
MRSAVIACGATRTPITVGCFSVAVRCLMFVAVGASALIAAQEVPKPATLPILANVLDLRGNAIRDLSKSNFKISFDKKPITVLDARYTQGPRRIVVLLDMSGSMQGDADSTKWKIAKEAVEDLLQQTPADVPIAFLTFAEQVHDVFGFSSSRTSIHKWLAQGPTQSKNLKGYTALRDAIMTGLAILRPFRQGDSLYVITDGDDTKSEESNSHTKATLLNSGVRSFAFLFAEPFSNIDEEESYAFLTDLCRDSGGFVFALSTSNEVLNFSMMNGLHYRYDDSVRERIRSYTQGLNMQVNGFYVVEIATPIKSTHGKIKLEIVDDAGRKRKDVVFSFQTWLRTEK